MATRAIVLGTDGGTFWTGVGGASWSDDPSQAKAFASPREAWTAALSLRDTEGEYLEDSPVFLHLSEEDDPRSTRPVTSSVHGENRPALRRHWRQGFREALPPDLPARSGDTAIPKDRLSDYLRDTDWENLRNHHATPGALVSALDPAFRSAFTDLLRRDRQAADELLKQHVPDDLADRIRSALPRSDASTGERPAADASPSGPATEPNEIIRDRDREAVDGYTPSAGERAVFAQAGDGSARRGGASTTAGGNDGRSRDRPADPLDGVLVDHGAAPYRHQAGNAPSYFVSLRQTTGEVVTHWGLDLKRATEAAGAAIGDRVQMVREGRERVQVREPVRDQAGAVVDHATRETARTAWSVTVQARGASEPANGRTDALAEKVVALFTARRLAALPPEIQERFRALYDDARARLTPEQDPRTSPGSAPSPLSRERSLEREARGR